MKIQTQIFKNDYFTQQTEDAIIKYNEENDYLIKNHIFNHNLKYPFEQLIDNIIFDRKLFSCEENIIALKHDAIRYAIEQMHLYKQCKGKAFSYFNMILKNYLVNRSKEMYQKSLNEFDLEQVDYNRNVSLEISSEIQHDILHDFLIIFEQHIENNYEYYFKLKDKPMVNAFFILLNNCHNIENFNKKALYIMIREITDCKTNDITRVMNLLKKYYLILYSQYLDHEKVELIDLTKLKQLTYFNN